MYSVALKVTSSIVAITYYDVRIYLFVRRQLWKTQEYQIFSIIEDSNIL